LITSYFVIAKKEGKEKLGWVHPVHTRPAPAVTNRSSPSSIINSLLVLYSEIHAPAYLGQRFMNRFGRGSEIEIEGAMEGSRA
jgi:hypothetical protein